jgi:hypothetical protein
VGSLPSPPIASRFGAAFRSEFLGHWFLMLNIRKLDFIPFCFLAPSAVRSMEAFSGVLNYKEFPEGIQAFRRSLDSLRGDFCFPDGVTSQAILMCWDALIFDWVIPHPIAFPSRSMPFNRSNYQALSHLPGSTQIYLQLDLDQTNEAILQNMSDAVTAAKGQIGATLFIVGGLMALKRIPERSSLTGFGKSLAKRFWQLLSTLAIGLKCKVVYLGAGVAPRGNPANLQPHALQFLEEMVRLDRANNPDEVPLVYCDIYTPGSYLEYSSVGSVLQESTDMMMRFVRDFVIIAGENLNPVYKLNSKF